MFLLHFERVNNPEPAEKTEPFFLYLLSEIRMATHLRARTHGVVSWQWLYLAGAYNVM